MSSDPFTTVLHQTDKSILGREILGRILKREAKEKGQFYKVVFVSCVATRKASLAGRAEGPG
jgi:hypothetical protein